MNRLYFVTIISLSFLLFGAVVAICAAPALSPNVYLSFEDGTFAEYSLEKSTIIKTIPITPLAGSRRKDTWLRMVANQHQELLLSDSYEGPLLLWNGEKETPLNELRSGCSQHKSDKAWEEIRVFLSERKGVYYVASNCNYFTGGGEDSSNETEVLTVFTLRKHSALTGAREILRKEYPACKCSTGACSESCAKGVIYVPGGIFDTKFIFKSYVEGQLESRTEENILYTFNNWRCDAGKALPTSLSVADIAPNNTVLGGYADNACCSWVNTFSDQAVVLSSGGAGVNVYDEFQRYDNAKVDVNFSVSAMAFSPSGEKFVLQVTADYPYDKIIRWGADHNGAETVDAEISARISSLAEATPEIKIFDKAGKLIEAIPSMEGAGFAGWLGDNRILLKGKDRLVILEISTGKYSVLSVPGIVLVYVPKI